MNGEFGVRFGFTILFGANDEWRTRNGNDMCGFGMKFHA